MSIMNLINILDAQPASWLDGVLRNLTAFFVKFLYGAVGAIFKIIFTISEVTAGPDLLGDIYTRIYTILGVFMVFKLSFSFINYILNPDSFKDKERGVGKLITNVIIMLAALIFIPTYVFGSNGLLIRAQKAFLPMVPRIIMGIDSGTGAAFNASTDEETLENYGESMATAALSAFFTPISGGNCQGKPIESIDEFSSQINDTCTPNGAGVGQKYYKYRYDGLFALIVGVVMVVVLLGIAIEVGKRVFKLLILEILAPIPIMSLIDPKSAKGGSFSSWLKMTTSTFLDIFIKLGVLYFVIMMIGMLTNNTGSGVFGNLNGFLFVFLMIVLLLFAKEAPKFIKDALGLKGDMGGDFGLGALGTVLGVGAAAGSVAGSIVGAGATALGDATGLHPVQAVRGKAQSAGARAQSWFDKNQNKFAQEHPNLAKVTGGVGDVIGATAGAVGRGAMNMGRAARVAATGKGGYKDVMTAATSGVNSRIDRYATANKAFEGVESVLDKESSKAGTTVSSIKLGGTNVNYTGNSAQYEDAYQRAINLGNDNFSIGGHTFSTSDYARDSKAIKVAQRTEYLKTHGLDNEEVKFTINEYERAAKAAGMRTLEKSNYASLDDTNKEIRNRSFRERDRNANANKYKANKK